MIERGRPALSWYEEEPDLLPLHDFYLKSFWELSTERQIGMSLGQIPGGKIREYAREQGLEQGIVNHFTEVVRALDRAFLEWAEKQKKANKGSG